ncbi:antibiotic biosynthesis monooxygenase family protein [Deinococcus koreensis]|uniref:ABM domain-containing protein n=1 Tax=Deinococcus koreensis TaxID=2054903 RepID=A0A2K3UZ05_9DEIO|nr:antibiotic biosynthesis monooxygenase [Deinococcus koreensis]PNY81762.1 hypothetical protein CVO96_10575 [Deinococcus koreensis]
MASHVHYAEARGDSALATLREFLDALGTQPGLLSAELLSSPDQPGLYLVMSRWDTPIPPLTLPDGVRAWAFETLEERHPAR